MGKPTIYVFAPDLAHPLGGMRMLYRHVDILNANGFQSYIVHKSPRFEIKWFEHFTPVLRGRVSLEKDDIAVYSEIGGAQIAQWAKGRRKVIFNQNSYYTFLRYPLEKEVKTPYLHPEVIATIVVSEDSKNYLQYVFPKLPIYRIRYSINPKLYYITGKKKKQICLMPRKNLQDAKQVLSILRYRGVLKGWKIALIDKMSESEAAAIMRESLIMLSFGYPEGFGLPPAEGIACGSIVIGYHGNVREFLTPEHGFPIEVGDIVGYARTVEEVIGRVENDIELLRKIVRDGAEFIRREYSPEAERESIVSCWNAIVGR